MPGPRVKASVRPPYSCGPHMRPLQSGSLLAVRLKAADVTAARQIPRTDMESAPTGLLWERRP